jgi:hypothetical protein
LERLLKRGVDFRAELDLYTVWPEGLATLLEAGYEVDMIITQIALVSSAAALKLLRDTGNLDPEVLAPLLLICKNADSRRIVIQELAEGRKKFVGIAMTSLPTETILQLRVRPDTLLGYQAAHVHALLEGDGIETGDIDFRRGRLIYETAGLDTELADQFWEIGFRDVDDRDDQGMTALMKLVTRISIPLGLLRMASWLIGKGADTGICPMIYDCSALHFLGATLGCSIDANTPSLFQLASSYEAVVHSILLDDSRDSCYCHCSSGGCTPLATFLGALVSRHRDIYYIQKIAIVIMADEFTSLISKSPEAFERKVIPDVFRLTTFRVLGITDTCAHQIEFADAASFHPFDTEEVSEIHEEERDLIQELECLVRDFICDYQRLSLPFETFLREHWCARMHEVLSKKESLSHVEKKQIRDIGVILESG